TVQMPPLSSSGLSYVILGNWTQTSSGVLASTTQFLFGYETPPAAMPTSGTASFSGSANGSVFGPGTPNFAATTVNGKAAFSADSTDPRRMLSPASGHSAMERIRFSAA